MQNIQNIQNIKNFTPREIVSELDKYIIGQKDAKKAVAIALRNRWRRLNVESQTMREDIAPKNIIMIGATGVGKTEIARRLSKLASAPFVKVEASKFTEVGYVGKDVESMIRELVETAVKMLKEEQENLLRSKAEELAEEHLLDILIPKKPKPVAKVKSDAVAGSDEAAAEKPPTPAVAEETADQTREKMRQMLRAGKLDSRLVELDAPPPKQGGGMPMIEVVTAGTSMDDITKNLKEMFSGMFQKSNKRRKVKVTEALQILATEEVHRLVDMEEVVKQAIIRVEQNGIVFIDEIDKIASREKSSHGPDISREGVQRDILPIVEGCNVTTKYGMVKTDHILFIAAGAFHVSKPSDLIPELQGRFPIRVELSSLTREDFLRILTEPESALIKQYMALMKTEKVDLQFDQTALEEIARYAADVNEQMENIGARRLHTILEKVLEEISFVAPEKSGEVFLVTADYVKQALEKVVQNQDLSRYIL